MARPNPRFCGTSDHAISRRLFLGSTSAMAAGVAGVNVLGESALGKELQSQNKRVILLWLAGGASQLETFDPKPGRPTGGPFRAIPTSVPGVHISELMPKMAQRFNKHTAIIRSLNTRIGDHGGGAKLMMRGRLDEPNLPYPDMGAIIARELGHAESPVPDYVSTYSETEGRSFAPGASGFLGARYNSINLTTSMIPENIRKLNGITAEDHQQRAALRNLISNRFSQGRDNPVLGSHNQAYSRVAGLMGSEKLFDVTQESMTTRTKYGPTQFGEQALIARRLVEAGVPFVRLGRAWWDSHGQNFETHLELVSELDHVMCALLDDLEERGLLDHTLVVTLSEFGRTPGINSSLGRDHFANAWSCSLSGCGIKGGACYGKTDADGQNVAEGKVGAGELLATIFQAVGVNPRKEYHVGARPIPLTDPGTEAVKEVLA